MVPREEKNKEHWSLSRSWRPPSNIGKNVRHKLFCSTSHYFSFHLQAIKDKCFYWKKVEKLGEKNDLTESNYHSFLLVFKVKDKACSNNEDRFDEECLWISLANYGIFLMPLDDLDLLHSHSFSRIWKWPRRKGRNDCNSTNSNFSEEETYTNLVFQTRLHSESLLPSQPEESLREPSSTGLWIPILKYWSHYYDKMSQAKVPESLDTTCPCGGDHPSIFFHISNSGSQLGFKPSKRLHSPWTGWQSITGLTHKDKPNVHIMWEEAKVPEEYPRRHRETASGFKTRARCDGSHLPHQFIKQASLCIKTMWN